MDSTEGQNSRIFIGNVAPDTDPDLISQHFKVCTEWVRLTNLTAVFDLKRFF